MSELDHPPQFDHRSHAPPTALNVLGNPILRRYRRSQMRPVRLGITIVLTLVIAGFIATMAYLPLHYRAGFTIMDAARAAFLPLLIYQAIVLAVFGTAAIGSGILRESEEGMIEYQRLTPLSPLAKVLGYLFGLPVRQYVAFGVTAVFSALSIWIGQIPFLAWGSVYLVLFTTTLLYHLLGLMTGQIIKSRWRAGLISIGLVLFLNLVLPRLADFGFAMFSHLTIWPVVWNHLPDLMPTTRAAARWARDFATPEVPFWGIRMSHVSFCLLVQGTLIITFITMLARRWRDEQAHLLGKVYAVGWLLWIQVILLGNVLPLLDQGRIFTRILGSRAELMHFLRQVPATVEAYVLAVVYGLISLLLLVPIISCVTPTESTQMAALRRRKKFGQRIIPVTDDGATAAPWVWIAALATGAGWTVFVERLFTMDAFGASGFPAQGWAIFIGIVFLASAIFHFLLEGHGRRVAWMTVFLAGFIPLFTSLVLISIGRGWGDTARYLIGLSPLSAPWQPIQWLAEWQITHGQKSARAADYQPFLLFCAVHVGLFVLLFVGWRRKRSQRNARA